MEFYKNKFGGDPAFKSFIERSVSDPEKVLYKNTNDGLEKVESSKTVIEIEGTVPPKIH